MASRSRRTHPRALPETSLFLGIRGRRDAGRSTRPQPRVQMKKVHRVSRHGHTGNTRHSLRNGFNGFLRALPGDRALLPPSSTDCSADLTPASGRQDHTTSPSAAASFVRTLVARLTLPRPPHPVPYVRDDRETPLCVGRDGGVLELIWVGGEVEYFSRRGWTGHSVICPSGGLNT